MSRFCEPSLFSWLLPQIHYELNAAVRKSSFSVVQQFSTNNADLAGITSKPIRNAQHTEIWHPFSDGFLAGDVNAYKLHNFDLKSGEDESKVNDVTCSKRPLNSLGSFSATANSVSPDTHHAPHARHTHTHTHATPDVPHTTRATHHMPH